MGTITRTTPTFSQVEAPVVLTTGTYGTLRTLDLSVKDGARLFVRIGRMINTALTRAAYVTIRPTKNDTTQVPHGRYDVTQSSATTAAQNTTVNGTVSAGSATLTLTSATGFAIGDVICCKSDDTNATRPEWLRICAISGNVVTFDRNTRVDHNNADRVNSLSDCVEIELPGGDTYEIRCINNSGQSVIFAIDAITHNGDTTA